MWKLDYLTIVSNLIEIFATFNEVSHCCSFFHPNINKITSPRGVCELYVMKGYKSLNIDWYKC